MAAKLISFKGLKNEAAGSKELPNRLKILNWGRNETLKGPVIVDERSLKVFETVQEKMGVGNLCLDFEHNTVPGSPEYKATKEPRDVAAHMTCSVVENDGVYCDVEDWTELGQKKAKNYKDLSPTPWTLDLDGNGENVLVGMHSVALTQHGAVSELTFLSADSDTPFKAQLMALSAVIPAAFETGSDENTKGYTRMKEHIMAVRKMMNMGDDVPDEEVMKCMSAAISEGKVGVRDGPLNNAGGTKPMVKTFSSKIGHGDVLHRVKGQNPGLEGFSVDALSEYLETEVGKLLEAKLEPLNANVTKLTAAAEEATKNALASQRQTLVQQAAKEFKVIPLSAEDIATLSIPVLEKLIKGLPRQNLQTRASQPALVKADANGAIKQNGARQITLSVDGQQVPITIDNGSSPAALPGQRLKRTSEIFAQQLQDKGLYCRS